MHQLAQAINDVDEETEKQLKSLAKKEIKVGTVGLHVSTESIDIDNGRYFDVNEKDKNHKSASFPIKEDQYNILSNLTLVFDSENKLTTYSETLITKSSDKFKFTIYTDGKLVKDDVSDIDYMNDSEIQEELDKIKDQVKSKESQIVQPASQKDTITCLAAALGVGTGVAAAIAYACVGSCLTPPTVAICAACIGGFAALGSASIGAIAACFQLWNQ